MNLLKQLLELIIVESISNKVYIRANGPNLRGLERKKPSVQNVWSTTKNFSSKIETKLFGNEFKIHDFENKCGYLERHMHSLIFGLMSNLIDDFSLKFLQLFLTKFYFVLEIFFSAVKEFYLKYQFASMVLTLKFSEILTLFGKL